MAVRKTVRIYDLAKELKQDTKRVMEELRRAGADVSVASNSVPVEFADKLRNKYISKAEAPAKPRAIKVIKAAKKDETAVIDEPVEVEAPVETPVEHEPVEVAEPEIPAPAVEEPEPAAEVRKTKVLKPRAKPAVEPEAAQVEQDAAVEEPAPAAAAEEVPQPEPEQVPEPVDAAPTTAPATGRTIKILRPTSEAVQKGIKAGDDRIGTKGPVKTGSLSQPAGKFQGTPGERTAPQMTYTPPADNRRRPGRSGGRKGRDDKGARFAERDIDVPRQTTIENNAASEQCDPGAAI